MFKRGKSSGVLPGFGLTMGFTLLYLSILLLLPLAALVLKATGLSWADWAALLTNERVIASFRISVFTALAAALINAVFGLIIAWVLVRYTFPGKKLLDALIDIPFALPTAVAGISLTAIYSQNGWMGSYLNDLGIKVAFTPIGITIALIFISFPFVVRTIQPVIQQLEKETEEAAFSLGAKRLQTFVKVVLPELTPAILTGFALAFARSLGEYGSVVFISGNMPYKTEIVSLLIMTKLEQYDYVGATALAVIMLTFSFVMLFIINYLQWRSQRKLSLI